jgi:hypothetical protein
LIFPTSEKSSIILLASPGYNCLSLLGAALKAKMNMEHWWIDSDRRNPIYLEKSDSVSFVPCKFYMD